MGGTLVRTIGLVRPKAKVKARIMMETLACNMRRPGQPGRLKSCPA
jgi:hypothetical protein